MIRLYEGNETVFEHNKRVINNELSVKVEEVANGMYEAVVELPSTASTADIEENMILVCDTADGEQPFRIYRKIRTLTGFTLYARHYTYDLIDNFIEDTRPTNTNGNTAINAVLSGTAYAHPFTGTSDITDTHTSYYIRQNPIQALMGTDETSFLNRWGGEIKRDGTEISINAEQGQNRGYNIRLGKNLLGIEQALDISEVVTRVYPTVVLENVVYELPEKYVDSVYVSNYPHPIIREMRVELTEAEQALTMAEIYDIMRAKANLLFAGGADLPKANYTVDFIQLKYEDLPVYPEEYLYTHAILAGMTHEEIALLTNEELNAVVLRNIGLLSQLNLYDTVRVTVDTYGIDITAKVIRTEWDSLAKRYSSIELGSFKPSLTNQKTQIKEAINQIVTEAKNELSEEIREINDKITAANGGYIVMRYNASNQPYEILAMDTDDINTAVNVLRINQNGIAGSTSGYNGPFNTAMTIDGYVLSERIITTSLSAISADLGVVTAGKIQNADSSVLLDLDNGTFSMGGKSGQVAKHTAAESIFNHSDGSYTKISSAGLEIYKSGLNKKYKALVHSGKTLSNSYPGAVSSGQVLNVTLPIEFDSLTDLKIYAWISRAKQSTGTNTIRSMEAVISDIEKGIDNRIRFKVTWSVVFNGSADATTGEVSYMAIA